MKSMKCSQCGMVNWASAEMCKRCGAHFQLANDTLFAQAAYATAQPAYAMPGHSAPHSSQSFPYQPPPYQYYYPPMQKSNGLAVASLIVGIVSIFTVSFLGLGALTSIVLGIVALVKIKNNPAQHDGQGMAIAGIVTGALSLVLAFFIVMAIAIPNVLAARRAANEASAIRQLRTIGSAELTYNSTTGNGKYGTLQQLEGERLISSELADGIHNGYRFSIRVKDNTRDTPATFEVIATPTNYGNSGVRSFYLDQTGVIHFAQKGGAEADANDTILGN